VSGGTPSSGPYNPVNLISTNATRTWTDLNGDGIPQSNELGPSTNANFVGSRLLRLTR